jgi:hypothetical protein
MFSGTRPAAGAVGKSREEAGVTEVAVFNFHQIAAGVPTDGRRVAGSCYSRGISPAYLAGEETARRWGLGPEESRRGIARLELRLQAERDQSRSIGGG